MNQIARRICIIGAECTGKTTLACDLSKFLNEPWVPEYARQYLETLKKPYSKADLLKIARGQIELEKLKEPESRKLLICDTNLLVIKVWSDHKYGESDPKIMDLHRQQVYHHYLLTDSEIPWEVDSQRENPDLRNYFQKIYFDLIKESRVSFSIISGSQSQRMEQALAVIKNLQML
jgi:nicotinamide riboside kinase